MAFSFTGIAAMWFRTVSLILIAILLIACGAAGSTRPTPTAGVPAEVTVSSTVEPTPKPVITGWWNDKVFYEVFVRSFQDSDGDGVGDINGLISRLDYLQSLGVTGLWLMPVAESPSYHGYDVVDYMRVDQEYGTNEDFLRLMDEAHARDMVVIVDHVINHTSREHPWFQAALDPAGEQRDWYVWEATAPKPQGWHTTPGGAYYGYFWEGMPDLNYRTPEVTEAIYDATRFWLEDMGVDGLRLDAIKYLIEGETLIENSPETHAWLRDFHTFYKGINPDAFTVGEIWSSSNLVATYVPDQMDVAFDFDLADAMVTSALTGKKVNVERAIANTITVFPVNQYATFLTNHDQERVRSVLFNDEQNKTAAAMLLLHPGIPFLYYGEEIGMQGKKPDENIRRPMPWTGEATGGFTTAPEPWHPFFEAPADRNVADQEANPSSLLNHYRALIQLRNRHAALRTGTFAPLVTDNDGVYAFLREDESETLLVVINLSNKPVTGYTIASGDHPLKPYSQASLIFGGGAVSGGPTLTAEGGFSGYTPLPELPPTSSFVIQLTMP